MLGTAAATQTEAANPDLLLHGTGRSPAPTGTAAAPPKCGCRPRYPCTLGGPGRTPLPSQDQKCLLPLPAFSLLLAPALILEQSQGGAWVL